jgi:hypothetical protein
LGYVCLFLLNQILYISGEEEGEEVSVLGGRRRPKYVKLF